MSIVYDHKQDRHIDTDYEDYDFKEEKKMNVKEILEIECYKKQIDEDFKNFNIGNGKLKSRFIQLEKSWINNISHKIMPIKSGFEHEDRKFLRMELFNYLNKKKKGLI